MTNLESYKLSLFERCESGLITEEERDVLLEAVSDDEVLLEANRAAKEYAKNYKALELKDEELLDKFEELGKKIGTLNNIINSKTTTETVKSKAKAQVMKLSEERKAIKKESKEILKKLDSMSSGSIDKGHEAGKKINSANMFHHNHAEELIKRGKDAKKRLNESLKIDKHRVERKPGLYNPASYK